MLLFENEAGLPAPRSGPSRQTSDSARRAGQLRARQTESKGSKVPNYRVFRVSILGIAIMVLGRYLRVGYLDS